MPISSHNPPIVAVIFLVFCKLFGFFDTPYTNISLAEPLLLLVVIGRTRVSSGIRDSVSVCVVTSRVSSLGRTVQYNDLSNRVYTFRTETAPPDYQKKATLLLYFAQYMDEHLIHGGDSGRDFGAWTPTGIFMKKWFRTDRAIVMYLNNGTLQVRIVAVPQCYAMSLCYLEVYRLISFAIMI